MVLLQILDREQEMQHSKNGELQILYLDVYKRQVPFVLTDATAGLLLTHCRT